MTDRHAELRRIADFDHPFRVTDAGTVGDAPDVYAPDVYHSETDDVDVMGAGWEPLTGYTGQYGYNGAVMHASEYLGGRLADDILSTPGVYVVCVVNVHPEPAWPHVVDDTDGSCPECGTDDASDGNCPSHPDYPDTDGMSYGELVELQSELAEQEPAGWCVLRLSTGSEDTGACEVCGRVHVNYPHEPGRLYDCPACESACHCTPGHTECVYAGPHNGLAAPETDGT